jgi:ankyrin repeat protein
LAKLKNRNLKGETAF